jgi:hypothetical protein
VTPGEGSNKEAERFFPVGSAVTLDEHDVEDVEEISSS